MNAKTKGRSPALSALVAALLLWLPIFFVQGIVFQRDPSFFSSVQADTSWSLGAFSFQGGVPNIQTQGLFYEPYAVVIWLLSHIGLNFGASGFSKFVPFAMTIVAAWGAFSLSKKLGAGAIGCWFGTLFYIFNPWSLDSFGYFYIWTGYCLMPLLILGVMRIRDGERTPIWFPIAIVFLGGLICWVVAACVCILIAASSRGSSLRRIGRTISLLVINFLGAGAFWIFAYILIFVSPSSGFSLSVPSTGPPLQSSHPLVDLLSLRDFWWPHLDLHRYFGILELSISTTVTVLLVIMVIVFVAFDSSLEPLSDGQSPRLLLGSLLILGLILGEGTAGIAGWVYRAIRAWPFFGSSIIRSLTRSPANLALPFVSAISIALSLFLTPSNKLRGNSNEPHSIRRTGLARASVAIFALIVVCTPSLVSFWHVYEPIKIPSTYGELASKVSKGVSLEIGYFPISALSPDDGTWQYTWSHRAIADSTLLAAAIPSPSVSSGSQSISAVEATAVTSWSNAGGIEKLENLAHRIGVTNLIIETDIQLPEAQRVAVNNLVAALKASGLKESNTPTETIFVIPGPVREAIWSNRCTVNGDLFFTGFVHITCHGGVSKDARDSIVSPFVLPAPITHAGLAITSRTKVAYGVGTEFHVEPGSSGWLVFLPNLFATVGGVITIIFLALRSVPFAVARVISLRRRRAQGA